MPRAPTPARSSPLCPDARTTAARAVTPSHARHWEARPPTWSFSPKVVLATQGPRPPCVPDRLAAAGVERHPYAGGHPEPPLPLRPGTAGANSDPRTNGRGNCGQKANDLSRLQPLLPCQAQLQAAMRLGSNEQGCPEGAPKPGKAASRQGTGRTATCDPVSLPEPQGARSPPQASCRAWPQRPHARERSALPPTVLSTRLAPPPRVQQCTPGTRRGLVCRPRPPLRLQTPGGHQGGTCRPAVGLGASGPSPSRGSRERGRQGLRLTR